MHYLSELCPVGSSMPDMKIIGLTGRAGAGKDSVADVLERLGYYRCSFAGDLKQAVLDLDPYVKQDGNRMVRLSEVVNAYGLEDAKRVIPEVRRLLQVFGTEVVRKRDENFWISKLERHLRDLGHPKARRVVVTDVRFDNEASWVLQSAVYGSKVIEVTRPAQGVTGAEGHVSEFGVDRGLISGTVVNDGTLEELHASVEDMVLSGTW